MNKPLVSIIVPIYNVEKYISQCLNSIIKQTLKNIEIICVDDGSTDNSLNIIKQFAKQDSRIKIISKKNSGYGHTMNVGFDAATGEYIGIVESDDYVNKNMFKFLYKKAKKYDAEILKSDFFEFSNNKQKYIMTPTHYQYYNKIINVKFVPEIFNFKMNTWTGLYKKDFIEKYNIKHNETPGASFQDNGFWFQTITFAQKIVFVSKAFYHYRQDNPNSSINNKQKIFCMCDEYDFINKFLLTHKAIKDDFYGWFLLKKFHNYIYTYSRIAEEHKHIFLEKFSQEFIISANNNEIDYNLFDEKNLKWLNLIINNPYQFEQTFNKNELNKFDSTKSNKIKKLLIYIKLFGLKNTLLIITQKTE